MNRVLLAAREALAFAKGEVDPNEYAVHATENNDVEQDSDIDPGVVSGEIESDQAGRCDLPARP